MGGHSYTVTATGGGSGNPVTFSSGTPGVCTVTGSTVTFHHAGTCTVDADQTGDADYQAAPTAGQSFTIGRGTQSITFTSAAPTNAVVGGHSYTVTATGGASGNPVTFSSGTPSVCTVTGATVTFQHAGTCTVDADQTGDADYQAAPTAGQSFAVGKDTQSITFTSTAPTNAVVGGHSYTVTATGGGSGNPVTFSSGTPGVCTVTGSTVTFQHAGTCTIDADQAGDADHLAAATATQSFAVNDDVDLSVSAKVLPPNDGNMQDIAVTVDGLQPGGTALLTATGPDDLHVIHGANCPCTVSATPQTFTFGFNLSKSPDAVVTFRVSTKDSPDPDPSNDVAVVTFPVPSQGSMTKRTQG